MGAWGLGRRAVHLLRVRCRPELLGPSSTELDHHAVRVDRGDGRPDLRRADVADVSGSNQEDLGTARPQLEEATGGGEEGEWGVSSRHGAAVHGCHPCKRPQLVWSRGLGRRPRVSDVFRPLGQGEGCNAHSEGLVLGWEGVGLQITPPPPPKKKSEVDVGRAQARWVGGREERERRRGETEGVLCGGEGLRGRGREREREKRKRPGALTSWTTAATCTRARSPARSRRPRCSGIAGGQGWDARCYSLRESRQGSLDDANPSPPQPPLSLPHPLFRAQNAARQRCAP